MEQEIKNYTVAGIGELLWDVLPDAELLGGAPINFTYHVNALGARGIAISTIGRDERGEKALDHLHKNGIDTAAISITDDYPTGYVKADLDARGVATYHFPNDVAWDHLQINKYAEKLQKNLDAICFGSLALRSTSSRLPIFLYLDTLEDHCLRVFDINLRQEFYSADIILASLERSDIFKLNDEELEVLAGMLALPGSLETQLEALVERYQLAMIILTRGVHGSILMNASEISVHQGIKTSIVDTIGAGDSFTAMATLGYLQGLSLDEINHQANMLAAFVCSRQGAMPDDITPLF